MRSVVQPCVRCVSAVRVRLLRSEQRPSPRRMRRALVPLTLQVRDTKKPPPALGPPCPRVREHDE
jgi:hypothetical protein